MIILCECGEREVTWKELICNWILILSVLFAAPLAWRFSMMEFGGRWQIGTHWISLRCETLHCIKRASAHYLKVFQKANRSVNINSRLHSLNFIGSVAYCALVQIIARWWERKEAVARLAHWWRGSEEGFETEVPFATVALVRCSIPREPGSIS